MCSALLLVRYLRHFIIQFLCVVYFVSYAGALNLVLKGFVQLVSGKMEKGSLSEGCQSKASQADIYPPRQTPGPPGYEGFGEMFTPYYYNPQSYLEGLKYHMKGFGEQSAALQAIYGPQICRKLENVNGNGPPPASEKERTLDLSSEGNVGERQKGQMMKQEGCSQGQNYQYPQTSPSSSSSSSPSGKSKLDCFYCDFSHLQPVNGKPRPKPEKFLPCDKCDYFTALSSSLKSHMLKHTDERPLKCEYCDYSTKHASALKLHVTKHTGILAYSCDQCSYRTASSSSLKSHMLKHTDIKHLQCPFCDYSTKHKNALKMHMCKHNGVQPYTCPQCDYKSASPSCLKSHMLKHTDIKPQKCAYCDYATKHKSALRNHLKKHATLPFCHVII